MDVYQRRRLVALSALAGIFIVFVLLIRSCGGDDEEEPVTPVAGATGLPGAVPTQSDYIAEGDAICLEANTSLANVDQADAAAAAADESDIVTSQLQSLQSLTRPDEGTEELDRFLNTLEKLATAYDDRATAAERDDQTAIADLDTTIDTTYGKLADKADAFGFDVCGDPSEVGEADTTGEGESTETTDSGDGGTAPTETPVVPEETVPPATEEVPPVVPPAEDTAPPAEDTGGTSGSGGVSP